MTAIIELARALGMEAVAEGVENEDQRAFLVERGCPLAQGYLLGPPGARRTRSSRCWSGPDRPAARRLPGVEITYDAKGSCPSSSRTGAPAKS